MITEVKIKEKKFMRKLIKSPITSPHKDVSVRSVGYCLDFYIEDYTLDAGLKSKESLFYRAKWLYDFFKDTPINSLQPTDILNYKRWRRLQNHKKSKKDLANNTLAMELTVLKSALNRSVEYGIIKNINDKKTIQELIIKVPKLESRNEQYIPSIEEAELIMSFLPPELYRVAFCAHRLGYRRAELISLKFNDISLKNFEIRLPISKNKRGRNTPLYPEIHKFLTDVHEDAQKIFERKNVNDVPVFRQKDNRTALNPANIRYHWIKAIKKARVPDYHFHDLRKSAIKYLKHIKDFPRDMIKELYTGHKSWNIFNSIYDAVTTEDYMHWKAKALKN
jgi:integrase